MDVIQIALFSLIIFFSFFIQGVTGFGSAIIALPLISMFLPISSVIPILLVLSILQNSLIVYKEKKYINKNEIKKVLLIILLGIPFGIIFFNKFPEKYLKIILSIIIILIAIIKMFKVKNNLVNNKENKRDYLYLFFGGCVQGAFGTGGPLIVIYFIKKIQDKVSFRATMCCIWLIINIVIILQKLVTGWYNIEIVKLIGLGVIFIFLGTYFGNKVHNNVSQDKFNKVSYIILLGSGLSLLLNTL